MSTTVYIPKPDQDMMGIDRGAEMFLLTSQINGILNQLGFAPATIENANDEFFAVTVDDRDAAFGLKMFAPFPVQIDEPEPDRIMSLEDLMTDEQKLRLAEARRERAERFAAEAREKVQGCGDPTYRAGGSR